MKVDLLKHTIVNTVKSLWYSLKKPERNFLRIILENMLEHKTTVLSKLWDTKEMNAKATRNYYTKHLWKDCFSDLKKNIEKILVKFIWKLDKNSAFCFDSVDINKNSAKKMEDLKIVRDGSTGSYWNGYVLHWVSVRGIPLLLEREKLEKENKDKCLRFEIFENQIERIDSLFWNWYWILADRYYDDSKKYSLLLEKWFHFAFRAKTNRYVEILEWNNIWKIMRTWDLWEWRYKIKMKWVKDSLLLFIQTLKWQDKPIRVISDTDNLWVIEKYLERWEIERLFKTSKQEYSLEKIGTKEILKTENLISLVQLCLWISAYIYDKIEPIYGFWKRKIEVTTMKNILEKLKPFLREKALKLNRNSITSFLAYYMKFVRKMKFYFRSKSRVTLKPICIWQLSLNF